MPQVAFKPLGVFRLPFLFPQDVFSFQFLHQVIVFQSEQVAFFFPCQLLVVAYQFLKATFSFHRQTLRAASSFRQSQKGAFSVQHQHQGVTFQL